MKEVLNKQAQIKKKYLRVNESPFVKKELDKVIITRSRLRNVFLWQKSNHNQSLVMDGKSKGTSMPIC